MRRALPETVWLHAVRCSSKSPEEAKEVNHASEGEEDKSSASGPAAENLPSSIRGISSQRRLAGDPPVRQAGSYLVYDSEPAPEEGPSKGATCAAYWWSLEMSAERRPK